MAAVCCQWRNLALSFTALWSTFRCIKPACDSVQQMKRERKRLELYLKRSGNSGLDLEFEFNALPPKSALWKTWAPLLNCAIKHAHRWARFAIKSDGVAPRLYLVPLEALQAPRLESLEIHAGTWDDWQWQNQYNRTCIFASWETLSENQFGPPQGFNLRNYGTLPTSPRDPRICLLFSNFVQVLSAPNIETISIWGTNYEWWPSQPLPATTIQANRLKHFRYGNNLTMSTLRFFLHRVSAPLLESITLQKVSLSNQASGIDDPEDDHIDYAFPSFRSLHLIDVDVACLAVAISRERRTAIILETPVPRLVQTTRLAKHLTIATRAMACDIPLFIDLVPGFFAKSPYLPSMWPQVQDLAHHFHPSVLAANNLTWKDTWPKVDRLYLAPPTSNNPWPDPEGLSEGGRKIEVKGLQALGHTQWPPGSYQWASRDKTVDVFLRNTAL
ncbi:hypothetical protein D9611_007443 [Ephemerocybe angulata]|uniref:F-box domain-containing protein n=1 Tax=Ephemerocybe angulata TaxID=980116 RepID=A0A8H5CGW6_9AGAR|nr:hypothetical protein D9611_007443 [Tulosesus angulatus]